MMVVMMMADVAISTACSVVAFTIPLFVTDTRTAC